MASSRGSGSRSTAVPARRARASPSAGAWITRCWSTRWRPTTARCASSRRASASGSRARGACASPRLAGTDCTFDVTGREWKLDDGVLDQPGAFGNLPAGEAFVAPLAAGADGVCVIDGSIALGGEGLVDEPIRLTFERGRIVSIEGGRSAEATRAAIAAAGAGADVVAELGIGTNETGARHGQRDHRREGARHGARRVRRQREPELRRRQPRLDPRRRHHGRRHDRGRRRRRDARRGAA